MRWKLYCVLEDLDIVTQEVFMLCACVVCDDVVRQFVVDSCTPVDNSSSKNTATARWARIACNRRRDSKSLIKRKSVIRIELSGQETEEVRDGLTLTRWSRSGGE